MTDSKAETPYEDEQIRCPKLGHQVSFGYCRVERQDLPCQKAIACWHERFDVEGLFRLALTPEQFEEAFLQPPASKMVTLVELIERAKKLVQNGKLD
ncbi:MAG: hypothetical protein HY912_09090 [Desulfomonile tiedjei]|uniref:Uncharacterized protein n=1 Tax=Desulfomonile tiedjei TaxID=2358 RepID=A0A9D6V5T8_9BACT|nr:hypothetical protein [Desulfomonile tiedjei]